MSTYIEFPKIPRLTRPCVVTEKIDGTNALIEITPEGGFLIGSRTRYISPENDNYEFAKWANIHREELMALGVGLHFGEWWGNGIQRGYDLKEKRFSLFNTGRWTQETIPECCHIVPILYNGPFETTVIGGCLDDLSSGGSVAAPGFMRPEGVIIYHVAAGQYFKKTIEKDEEWKGLKQNTRGKF